MPGKFEGAENEQVAEALYNAAGESMQDEEAGDVQETGIWSALFRGIDVHDGEIKEGFSGGYILQEDDQGFVDYTEFETDEALQEAWDWILAQDEKFREGEDEF